jgi:HlyD family secretion protein
MKKWLKRLITTIVVLGVIAGGLYGGNIYYQNSQAQQRRTTLASLQTVKVVTGTIQATVGATGSLRTNQSATIAWQTSGKVRQVNVKVGSVVKTNDVLAALDSLTLSQNLITAKTDLVSAQTALQNLQDTQLSLAQAQQTLVNAQTTFNTAKNQRASLSAVHGTKAQIDSAQADVLSLANQVDKAQTAFDKVSDRDPSDLTRANALAALENLKAQYTTALNNLAYLQGSPTADEIAKADANLAVAQAQLTTAQQNYDTIKKGPNPNDVAAAQAKIEAIRATLDEQNLKAPFDGTITNIAILPGDLVTPNTYAFRIDDLTSLYIDLSVSEVDINNVQIGQKASLTFDAILNKTYNGEVVDVGQIGTVSGGVVNFNVTIKLTDGDKQVKPGMTASATLIVSAVDNVMMVPSRAIKTVNNQKVVYIMTNGTFNTVRVQTGATSSTDTQITSPNIKVGDVVVTNPPTNLLQINSGGGGFLGLGGLFGGIFGGGGRTGVPGAGGGFPGGGGFTGGGTNGGTGRPGGTGSTGGGN